MDLLAKLFIGLAVILIAGLIALLGGTIVWLIWPVTFPVIFPSAVASGVLVAKIPWWTAVCTTWICAILFKSSSSNKSEKES